MSWRSAVAILVLCSTFLVGACSDPAQREIDRGDQLAADGKDAEAMAAYQAAIALDPNSAEALVGRACLTDFDNAEAAIADLDRAIEIDPQVIDGYRCRSDRRLSLGDQAGAFQDARSAIEVDDENAVAYVSLGNVLDRMGRTAEAIVAYDKAVELAPALAYPYVHRSNARTRLDDKTGARADLDKAIELDPGYGRAFAYRAINRATTGDYDGALSDATRSIELEPKSAAYAARAVCHADAGDLETALDEATKAVELDPSYALAVYVRGLIHGERGELDAARADFDEAVRLDKSDAMATLVASTIADYALDVASRGAPPVPVPIPSAKPSADLVVTLTTLRNFPVADALMFELIVEVKNRGEGHVSLADSTNSHTILDHAGGVLAGKAFIYVFPQVIGPGESGYFVEGDVRYPSGTTVEDIGEAQTDITGYDVVGPAAAYDVSGVDVSVALGLLEVKGGVKNPTTSDATNGIVGVILFGPTGDILGAVYDNLSILTIEAGQSKGFYAVYPPTPPITSSEVASTKAYAFDMGYPGLGVP